MFSYCCITVFYSEHTLVAFSFKKKKALITTTDTKAALALLPAPCPLSPQGGA